MFAPATPTNPAHTVCTPYSTYSARSTHSTCSTAPLHGARLPMQVNATINRVLRRLLAVRADALHQYRPERLRELVRPLQAFSLRPGTVTTAHLGSRVKPLRRPSHQSLRGILVALHDTTPPHTSDDPHAKCTRRSDPDATTPLARPLDAGQVARVHAETCEQPSCAMPFEQRHTPETRHGSTNVSLQPQTERGNSRNIGNQWVVRHQVPLEAASPEGWGRRSTVQLTAAPPA